MSLTTNEFYMAAAAIVIVLMFIGYAYSRWMTNNIGHMIPTLIGGIIGGIISVILWFFAVKKNPVNYAMGGSGVMAVPDYINSMRTRLNL